MKLQKSQTLVWPRSEKTLNTKNDTFWYIHYISVLEKAQDLKLSQEEDKIHIYNVSKFPPLILYILGDMIPPIYSSSLLQDSSINSTPGENCYISIYEGPN